MLISNKLSDYTPDDIQILITDIAEINAFLDEINHVIVNEKDSPLFENIIYINPSIKREFFELETHNLPLDEVISIYKDWVVRIFLTISKNIGNFKNTKLQFHLDELISICRSFFILAKTIN